MKQVSAGKAGQNKQQRASAEPCRKPVTTVFVCHHDLAGYGSAIILPINDVFLELVLTGHLMKQPQPSGYTHTGCRTKH